MCSVSATGGQTGRNRWRHVTAPGFRLAMYGVSWYRVALRACCHACVHPIGRYLTVALLCGLMHAPWSIAAEPVAAVPVEQSFVVEGTSPEHAARIIEEAESLRRMIARRLVGLEVTDPWQPRCLLAIHTTPDAFTSAVGVPPSVVSGATSLEFAGDDVSLRRVDLMSDGITIPGALAHELVHVILGDLFLTTPPPRWADEGLAIMFDTSELQRRHEDDFQKARRSGQAWPLRELFELELQPTDGVRQRIFYGQSASVVRWLLAKAGTESLLRCLDDAGFEGHAAAIGRHYGFPSIEAMEAAWRDEAAPPP